MTPRRALRTQLLLWLLIPNVILWIVAAASTLYGARAFTNAAYDDGLADTVRTLAERVRLEQGKLRLDLPPAAIALLQEDSLDSVYYQILGPDKQIISGDPSLPAPPAYGESVKFFDGRFQKREVRIASRSLLVQDSNDPSQTQEVYIQAAETLTARKHIALQIMQQISIPFVLAILLATLAVWLAVSKSLAPLERLRKAVDSRSYSDLSSLGEESSPAEVRSLVEAINGLLNRIAEERAILRRFIGNAAHSLRTPLAGIKTQAELAMRENTYSSIQPLVQQIHRGITHMNRLVKQLLALARAEPGASNSGQFQVCDLAAIAREVALNLEPQAHAKRLDFGVEAEAPAPVLGDRSALQELVTNLLENAVNYTPAGGTVTTCVTCDQFITLRVEDTGPGIPEGERTHVFERFYRIRGTEGEGTGLGLAIVQEIAGSHNARINLAAGSRGKGAAVEVIFTKSDSSPH